MLAHNLVHMLAHILAHILTHMLAHNCHALQGPHIAEKVTERCAAFLRDYFIMYPNIFQ